MSVAPIESMLPLVVRPLAEESLIGLIGRQADALCASHAAMLRHLGIRHGLMLSDETWARLADALGLEEASLKDMRRTNVALGRASGGIGMLGLTLRYHLVAHSYMRVCPACIAEERSMLERWDIAHAPVCLRHGTRLVDACRCGRPLSRRYRGPRFSCSCTCGELYATLEAPPARPGLLTMGRIVDEAIRGSSHDGLDPELRGLPLSDILCIAHIVGVAATTPAFDDRHVEPRGAVYGSVRVGADLMDVASMADLVEAATPYLLSWSDTYPGLLAAVARRNGAAGTADADSVFATAIGRTLRRPPRGIDGIPLACMTRAVERFCLEEHGIRPRRTSHRRDSPVGRKIAPHLSRRNLATALNVHGQAPLLVRTFDGVVRSFDDEGLAQTTDAKALADLVEQEVLRRWRNTQETVSLDRATRELAHGTSTHNPSGWMVSDLLTPIDAEALGVDKILVTRRRGRSFLKADVDGLHERIASRVELVGADANMDGYETLAQCRKYHGGGWPRIDFIRALLDGRIPARARVERPKISEVWLLRDAVRDLALEHRVKASLEKDVFAIAHRCRTFVTAVWGKLPDHFTDYHLRHLRRTGAVRFKDVRNTTEGRDRPLYHFSLADLLERALLLQGASLSPSADKIIEAYRQAKAPSKRVVVDEQQIEANAYLANLAAHLHRQLSAPAERAPPPNADRKTIPGWRRTGDRQRTPAKTSFANGA